MDSWRNVAFSIQVARRKSGLYWILGLFLASRDEHYSRRAYFGDSALIVAGIWHLRECAAAGVAVLFEGIPAHFTKLSYA